MWCAVHLLGEHLLFVEIQICILLTEVPIDHIFHWDIHAAVGHMVSAAEGLCLYSQVHFQVDKEVNFFSGLEGD